MSQDYEKTEQSALRNFEYLWPAWKNAQVARKTEGWILKVLLSLLHGHVDGDLERSGVARGQILNSNP